jgi:subtilase family serine protease
MYGLFRDNRSKSYSVRRQSRVRLEELEPRNLLSMFTPAQIRHAYGFDQITFSANGQAISGDGSGQTIAIVDAYDDPNIQSDLHAFDQQFNINEPASFFTKTSPSGVLPAADPNWAVEIALDVEWAHAIASGAKILLVEAASDSLTDLLNAVKFAAAQPGVDVVSMSWGANEFPGETALDSVFTTPAGHNGVTFVAASGDSGAWYGVNWPASSPDVLSVGGTSLYLTSSGNYAGETGWRGSGGGFSSFETEPTYQTNLLGNNGVRSAPDLGYNANPNTGYYVYDTFMTGGNWFRVGGTSAGAPQIAAMIAIADQGRMLNGKSSLDGRSQTLPAIYAMAQSSYSRYFHDVTYGFNGYPTKAGYDLVTGLGTPKANAIVGGLVSTSLGGNVASSVVAHTSSTSSGSTTSDGSHQRSGTNSAGRSISTPSAVPVVIALIVNLPLSSRANPSTSQSIFPVPTAVVVDARSIGSASPAPRGAETQESGGGDNALIPVDQDQDEPADTDRMEPLPDTSTRVPRIAPERAHSPEGATPRLDSTWQSACDDFFANCVSPGTLDVASRSSVEAKDSLAAFVGLGAVLQRYGAASTPDDEIPKTKRASMPLLT